MKFRKKQAARDFTEAMMPHTRKAVFLDALKMNWFEFMLMGLLMFVLMIPILLVDAMKWYTVSQIMLQVSEETTPEIALSLRMQIAEIGNTAAIIKLPLYVVYAIVFSGLLRIIRQLAWEEVVVYRHDFWKGVKQNWKQTVCVAIIIGVLNNIGTYLSNISTMLSDQTLSFAASGFNGVSLLIIFPILFIHLVCVAVYNNTFIQNFRIGMAIYAHGFLKVFLCLLCAGVFFVIKLYPLPWLQLVCGAVGALLLPISLLAWMLCLFNLLDKYINKTYYPEMVRKGLYTSDSNI